MCCFNGESLRGELHNLIFRQRPVEYHHLINNAFEIAISAATIHPCDVQRSDFLLNVRNIVDSLIHSICIGIDVKRCLLRFDCHRGEGPFVLRDFGAAVPSPCFGVVVIPDVVQELVVAEDEFGCSGRARTDDACPVTGFPAINPCGVSRRGGDEFVVRDLDFL